MAETKKTNNGGADFIKKVGDKIAVWNKTYVPTVIGYAIFFGALVVVVGIGAIVLACA